MPALRLALHHMKSNPPRFSDGSRGSVVLVSSTSGYFGGTGVTAYIASKHGVTGLLRSSQLVATASKVRVNAVAPCFTPTQITAGLTQKWSESGMESNTPQSVAAVIAHMAVDPSRHGACCLVRCLSVSYFSSSPVQSRKLINCHNRLPVGCSGRWKDRDKHCYRSG